MIKKINKQTENNQPKNDNCPRNYLSLMIGQNPVDNKINNL